MAKIMGYVDYEGRTIGLIDEHYTRDFINKEPMTRLQKKRKKQTAKEWYQRNRDVLLAKMRQKRLEK